MSAQFHELDSDLQLGVKLKHTALDFGLVAGVGVPEVVVHQIVEVAAAVFLSCSYSRK